MPWNWKVMFENFNDGYHANRLHQFVQDFCPSSMSAFPEPWDDASNVVFRTAGYTHIDGGFNATHRVIMDVFPNLTDEERSRSTFALVPPMLCFGTAPDQCFFFLVRPTGPETIDVEIGYIFHPSALEDPLFEAKLALSDAGVQVFVRTGPGRHHQGAAGPAVAVRAAGAVLVAGGEPRPVQPLAGPALPGGPARGRRPELRAVGSESRPVRPIASGWCHMTVNSDQQRTDRTLAGKTISPEGGGGQMSTKSMKLLAVLWHSPWSPPHAVVMTTTVRLPTRMTAPRSPEDDDGGEEPDAPTMVAKSLLPTMVARSLLRTMGARSLLPTMRTTGAHGG